jgi:hypothetical protein
MQPNREATTDPVASLPGEDGARRSVHSTLRLQPVLLGPPPDPNVTNVSAEDDIDPAEIGARSRIGKIAAAAAVAMVLGTAGVAYWALTGRDGDVSDHRLPPTTPDQPAPSPVVAAPPPTAADAPRIDMGGVDSDLIPPSTEGLNPPRRVQAIRIRVENDKEVIVPQ